MCETTKADSLRAETGGVRDTKGGGPSLYLSNRKRKKAFHRALKRGEPEAKTHLALAESRRRISEQMYMQVFRETKFIGLSEMLKY